MKTSKFRYSRAATKTYPMIVKFFEKNGRPPTVREIRDELGYASTNMPARDIKKLEKMGWLMRLNRKTLVVPGMCVTAGKVVRERLAGHSVCE